WSPYWWAGYPELQFYPPGFVLVMALLRALTLGRLSPLLAYQILVFLALVAPALGAYAFVVARGFGRWAGLAAALATLAFTDVTGGTFAAMDGSLGVRYAQAFLPLVLLAGAWAIDRRSVAGGLLAGGLGAALLLCHPFQLPLPMVVLGVYAGLQAAPVRANARKGAAGTEQTTGA